MIRKSLTLLMGTLMFSGFSQKNVQAKKDSLELRDFEYLEEKMFDIFEKTNDSLTANQLAQYYIKKAKTSNQNVKQIRGYYLASFLNKEKIAISFCDSALRLSKKKRIIDLYPDLYLNKGVLYFSLGEYKHSIDNLIFAKENIDKKNRPYKYRIIISRIANVRSLIGKHKEALPIFKEILKTGLPKNPEIYDINDYLLNLFGLAHTYRKVKELDSATMFNTNGIDLSKKFNKENYYSLFVLNEATNLFDKERYAEALDSVNIAIPILEKSTDSINLAIAYLYKGKLLKNQLKQDESLPFLKKADTIIVMKNAVIPYFVETYELLVAYYKEKQNVDMQLVYLEKLIEYNNKLNERYRYVNEVIQKKSDIPELLNNKQFLIDKLESRNKTISFRTIVLAVALAFMILVSFYYYRNRLKYKKSYEILISDNSHSAKEVRKAKGKDLGLPNEIIVSILEKLDKFENEKGFLDRSITLNNLARSMETNSNYLSKIINHSKNKNFSSYLTDLRINYMVIEIRKNSILWNYTIKAIAEEAGFGNAETFTKAFYKKTSIYPSYYIKKLKKTNS